MKNNQSPISEKLQQLITQIRNSSVKEIDLGYNQIGDVGAQDLAKALKINSSVEKINLRSNQISQEIISQIKALLKRNREMTPEQKAEFDRRNQAVSGPTRATSGPETQNNIKATNNATQQDPTSKKKNLILQMPTNQSQRKI